MGDTKELYASLFFAAGGFTKDLPSSDISLANNQYHTGDVEYSSRGQIGSLYGLWKRLQALVPFKRRRVCVEARICHLDSYM
jgi:hypothetical protein